MKHFFLLVIFLYSAFQIIFAGEDVVLETNSGSYVWKDISNGILGPYAGPHRLSRKTGSGNSESISFPTETHRFVKPRTMRCYADKRELFLELDIEGILFLYKFVNGEWICASDGIAEKYVSPEHTLVGEHVWLYRLLQKREEYSRTWGKPRVFERPFFAVLSAPELEGFSSAKDIRKEIEKLKGVITGKLKDSVPFPVKNSNSDTTDETGNGSKNIQLERNSYKRAIAINIGILLIAGFFLWLKIRSRRRKS